MSLILDFSVLISCLLLLLSSKILENGDHILFYRYDSSSYHHYWNKESAQLIVIQ